MKTLEDFNINNIKETTDGSWIKPPNEYFEYDYSIKKDYLCYLGIDKILDLIDDSDKLILEEIISSYKDKSYKYSLILFEYYLFDKYKFDSNLTVEEFDYKILFDRCLLGLGYVSCINTNFDNLKMIKIDWSETNLLKMYKEFPYNEEFERLHSRNSIIF